MSIETPILLSKAVESFIIELTARSWQEADSEMHRTLQRSDIIRAVSRSEMFDFLIDVVHRDDEHPDDVREKAFNRSYLLNDLH